METPEEERLTVKMKMKDLIDLLEKRDPETILSDSPYTVVDDEGRQWRIHIENCSYKNPDLEIPEPHNSKLTNQGEKKSRPKTKKQI